MTYIGNIKLTAHFNKHMFTLLCEMLKSCHTQNLTLAAIKTTNMPWAVKLLGHENGLHIFEPSHSQFRAHHKLRSPEKRKDLKKLVRFESSLQKFFKTSTIY